MQLMCMVSWYAKLTHQITGANDHHCGQCNAAFEKSKTWSDFALRPKLQQVTAIDRHNLTVEVLIRHHE